jgi:hypothetical protein
MEENPAGSSAELTHEPWTEVSMVLSQVDSRLYTQPVASDVMPSPP